MLAYAWSRNFPLANATSVLSMSVSSKDRTTRRMRVTSEGPTKITKATINAAWRRRKPEHRLIVRDRDAVAGLIVNASSMAWSYAYRPRGTDPVTGRRWPNGTITLGNPASPVD